MAKSLVASCEYLSDEEFAALDAAVVAAENPVAAAALNMPDIEDAQQPCHQGPVLNQVRGRGILWVTDLCSAEWCGMQVTYQALSRRPKVETASMRAGTKVHEAFEAEVVTRVELELTSAEDAIAARVLNVIAQLQQLLLTGLTREAELFARLRPGDPWIVGKLDEVALAVGQQQGGGDDGEGEGRRQYAQMVEIKTRSQPNKPRDGQARNACLQVLLYHRIYEAFRGSSLAELREFLLGGGRGRGWQRGGGGGGGSGSGWQQRNGGGSGGQRRNGGGGSGYRGRQRGSGGRGSTWLQHRPSVPKLDEGLTGAGGPADSPSSPAVAAASGSSAAPGGDAEAGPSPSAGVAAYGPQAAPGSSIEAATSPSAGVIAAGQTAGGDSEPADIPSGRSPVAENGVIAAGQAATGIDLIDAEPADFPSGQSSGTGNGSSGLDGGARLGDALQQQCFLVLPDHPLSAGRGLVKGAGGKSWGGIPEAARDSRGGGSSASDPAGGSGSATMGSHVGCGSLQDPIDLLQDVPPVPQHVPPVRPPMASPSSHWTLSALIEHLHAAVLPSLPPAAPGSPDGPAHLVRYYYRGIPGSAAAPAAALDTAAAAALVAAAAGDGGEVDAGGSSSLAADGGAPGGASGGFLKPDTEVRHEEWSSWLDYKIRELIDVLAGKASGRGVEEGEQWKCRYCAFRPSAQQGPVTCGGGGGYVQGVEEADDDAGLTCTWPIAAAGT